MVPVFKNIGESLAEIYCLIRLLFVGSKFPERLVNNRIVRRDHFSDFQVVSSLLVQL